MGRSLYCSVCQREWGRPGKQAHGQLGDQGRAVVAQSVRASRGVVGLVGVYLKSILQCDLFAGSQSRLTLGGAVCPGSARPRVPKLPSVEDKRRVQQEFIQDTVWL